VEEGFWDDDPNVEMANAAHNAAQQQAKILHVQGLDQFCGNMLWGSGLRISSTGCLLDWLLIEIADARPTSNKVSSLVFHFMCSYS